MSAGGHAQFISQHCCPATRWSKALQYDQFCLQWKVGLMFFSRVFGLQTPFAYIWQLINSLNCSLWKYHLDFSLAFPLSPTNYFVSKKNLLVWDGEELWWWQYIIVITIIVLLQNHLLQISKRCSFIPNPSCCCFEYWSGINQNSFIYCFLSATRSEVIRVCPRCNLRA